MISSAVAGLTALVLVHVLFKRFTRPSLSTIRGPKSPSLFSSVWQRRSVQGCLWSKFTHTAISYWYHPQLYLDKPQEDHLLVTDPKALQKMLNTSAYDYSKLPNLRVISRMLNGRGILSAEGEDHKRQRNIMLPGFGLKGSREFLPIFRECAECISIKWLEIIGNNNGQNVVLNVRAWVSRGALDAIGQAAFDVQFNTIRDDSHPLAKTYENFLGDIFGLPPAKQIFMHAASRYIPMGILQWILGHASNSRLARARDGKNAVTDVAKELLREKADALLQGKDNWDIFTLLVKANMDANAKSKLTDEELLAQMRLRDEIRKTEANIQARCDPQLTVTDLDAMPYFNAVIKEGLRFHTTAPHVQRIACRDDILPLSKPILTESGYTINEVPVPKGTQIMVSIAAYNRDKDLWGEDAHEFNPDRWLNGTMDEKKLAGIGVYSNLCAFKPHHASRYSLTYIL
ncbi:cytochrome P450 [Lanmaoa asiatica]|nr:cytochrome P450 [Lanmaoa asiatica]